MSRQLFDRSTIRETRVPITACPRSTISPAPDIAAATVDRRTLGRPTIVAAASAVSAFASDTTGSSCVCGYRASTEGVSGGIVSS